MKSSTLKIALTIALLIPFYYAVITMIYSVGQAFLVGFIFSPFIRLVADMAVDYYFPDGIKF
jgi:hypothetical protein